MALVCGVGAGGADAGVVGAAVQLRQPLVLLADLLLQVEGGLHQPVGRHGLHLGETDRRGERQEWKERQEVERETGVDRETPVE